MVGELYVNKSNIHMLYTWLYVYTQAYNSKSLVYQ